MPKGQFARNVATLAGGTSLAQFLSVATAPILTRLYSPEEFGVLAAFVSLFTVLLAINSLRYELAIPIAEDNRTAARLVILVFLVVILNAIALAVIFWLFSDQIVAWLKSPELKPFFWLLVLCLLGAGFYQALTYWALRKKHFLSIAHSRLVQSISLLTVQLGLGLASAGADGLIVGYAVGQIAGNLSLVKMIVREDGSSFRDAHPSAIWETAKRYRRFPLFASWSSLLNVGGLQLPALLLTVIYGPAVAGWFALSQRIIAIPMTIIGNAVSQVYFASASQLVHDDPTALERFFNRTASRLFLAGFLPITFIGLLGPWLFEHILGTEWRVAGEYVQVMAPMFLAQFVVSTLSQTIIILERQDIQSAWDLTRFLMVVGIFVLASALQLDAKLAIGLYSGCMLLTYGLLFYINRYVLRHHKKS